MSGEIYFYFIKTWNVEYFKCLGNMVTNCARCTPGITPRITMAKTAFNNQKESSFHKAIGLKLKEGTIKLHCSVGC
jgi:hypothetical protein